MHNFVIPVKTGIQSFQVLNRLWIPAYETVSQFLFLSFRAKREILMLNKFNMLRFLTFVRNDILPYYDTASTRE